jgi:hypothetical protein
MHSAHRVTTGMWVGLWILVFSSTPTRMLCVCVRIKSPLIFGSPRHDPAETHNTEYPGRVFVPIMNGTIDVAGSMIRTTKSCQQVVRVVIDGLLCGQWVAR